MRDHTNVRLIHDRIDPPITVSMDGDHVVIRPERHLDHDASMALISAVNAAVIAGATALIDLEQGTRSTARAVGPARRAGGQESPRRPVDAALSGITLAGPGCIRLRTTLSYWTVDLATRRFCRCTTPLEARFIGSDFWIGVRKLWISAESVSALTVTDSLISSRRPGSDSAPRSASFSVNAS